MAENFDPLDPWQEVASHPEVNNRWLTVKNNTFRLPNGQIMEDYYTVEKPSVAVAIPFRDGETYLIQEWERGVREVGYKFPGGKIDAGEDAAIAAARELNEELGLRGKLTHLGTTHIDPGLMPTKADYFLFEELEETGGRVDDPKELFVGNWVDLLEVADGVASNKIKNPFVIVGLALASSHLIRNRP